MSTDSSATIVSKVWNYAHVLKNAGVGYGDYVEQITYLLFLKLADEMADEMAELGFDPPSLGYGRARNPIPQKFAWSELSSKSGDDIEAELDRQITRSNRLRQSTLGAAFRGKSSSSV